MPKLLQRIKQRFCRHPDKRVWDVNRLPDGAFRVRVYCPRCGWRHDEVRQPDEIVAETAKNNPEMRETMRRNLGLNDEEG